MDAARAEEKKFLLQGLLRFSRAPVPHFDEHPDPDAYRLKKVYIFNPMNDPWFSVAHGSTGIKCQNGHLLRVIGPRQKAPCPVIGLCGMWYG